MLASRNPKTPDGSFPTQSWGMGDGANSSCLLILFNALPRSLTAMGFDFIKKCQLQVKNEKQQEKIQEKNLRLKAFLEILVNWDSLSGKGLEKSK